MARLGDLDLQGHRASGPGQCGRRLPVRPALRKFHREERPARADHWGSTGKAQRTLRSRYRPVAEEFPNFDPLSRAASNGLARCYSNHFRSPLASLFHRRHADVVTEASKHVASSSRGAAMAKSRYSPSSPVHERLRVAIGDRSGVLGASGSLCAPGSTGKELASAKAAPQA